MANANRVRKGARTLKQERCKLGSLSSHRCFLSHKFSFKRLVAFRGAPNAGQGAKKVKLQESFFARAKKFLVDCLIFFSFCVVFITIAEHEWKIFVKNATSIIAVTRESYYTLWPYPAETDAEVFGITQNGHIEWPIPGLPQNLKPSCSCSQPSLQSELEQHPHRNGKAARSNKLRQSAPP